MSDSRPMWRRLPHGEWCSACESTRQPGDAVCPWCEKPWVPASGWKPCSTGPECDPYRAVGYWVWLTPPARGCLFKAAWMFHPDVKLANPHPCN